VSVSGKESGEVFSLLDAFPYLYVRVDWRLDSGLCLI